VQKQVRPARSQYREGLRKAILAGALSSALLGLACAEVQPAPQPTERPPGDYIVGAPDLLHMIVLPDPLIERTLTVRPDGRITVELIGDVQASGLTTGQIAADIQKRISRYKRDARVTISVEQSKTDMITVFGEVAQPRSFPLERETRVAEAIGLVGGPTIFSSKGNVHVVRSHVGETQVIKVDLGAIEGGDLSTNVMLTGGDIVVVPPSWYAKIGYTLQIILMPLQPAMQAAGSVGGIYGLATNFGN